MTKFVCVYKKKKNGDYGIDYVQKLYEAFQEHTDMELSSFVCLSDDEGVPNQVELKYNWEGWWSKMELFRPEFTDDIFYIDLDTVIKGYFQPLLDKCETIRKPIMLSDFYFRERLASGVMWLPVEYRADIWERWIKDPEAIMRECGHYGDQKFIGEVYKDHAVRFQSITNEIISYKAHVKKGLAKGDETIICYHGKPRPRDTNWSHV